MLQKYKKESKQLKGKWEQYLLFTDNGKLVILGSDKRGTIYGIYELSRQIGVSPWYWMAAYQKKTFMAYCVLTCQKPKSGAADGGLSAHIDREKWDAKEYKMVPFIPDSVIHPELSHLNKEYLLPPGMGRTEAINKRIAEAGITRKIRDGQAKFLAFICTSDRETMLKIYNEGRWQAWVDANISFMQKTFGKENIVGCAGHMDEVTYHLHFTVVPIVIGQAAERPDTKKQHEKRNG